MFSFADKNIDPNSSHSSDNATFPSIRQLARGELTDKDIKQIAHFKDNSTVIAENYQTVRIAILSNGTTDFLKAPFEAVGVRYQYNIELFHQAYDQWKFQIHDTDYELYKFDPDFILIAEDHHALNLTFTNQHFSKVGKEERVAEQIEILKTAVAQIQKNTNAEILLQTVPYPLTLSLGIGERLVEGSTYDLHNTYNLAMISYAQKAGLQVVDIDRLSQQVGLRNWHDDRLWDLAKIPFSPKWLPEYADTAIRVINAIKGKTGRCLILDLDNTTWGGVVGDLGVQNVEIGVGTANGESFLRLQEACLQLKKRGVVLAVCSKNDEFLAKEVFNDNPNMLLKLDDIAVFKANWKPKAENIAEIAAELSLGISNMVFLDDNPVERFQVRERLPDVIVPEIGTDPSEYANDLLNCGAFDALELTNADFERSEQYKANKERALLEETVSDQRNFLEKLETVIEQAPFNEHNKQRVHQLINKSNQFNLTTIRYTLNELEELEKRPNSSKIFTFTVKDRFGSHGLVSVIVLKGLDTDSPYIDTWCMSCRVLKRKIEEAIMLIIYDFCIKQGFKKLKAKYIRTEKNDMVSNIYEELKFNCDQKSHDVSEWHVLFDNAPQYNPPIKIINN